MLTVSVDTKSFEATLKRYIMLTSKSKDDAIAHQAKKVVLGTYGSGGLYQLTREAQPSKDTIKNLNPKISGQGMKRKPGVPVQSNVSPASFRSKSSAGRIKQMGAMIAKGIVSKVGGAISYIPRPMQTQGEIAKRNRARGWASIGWLHKLWSEMNPEKGIQNINSKVGSIFSVRGQNVSFIEMANKILYVGKIEAKNHMIARAMANAQADMMVYIEEKLRGFK